MFQLLKKVFLNWLRANVFEHAAALAYSSLFSIGPMLLVAIRVSGLIFGEKSAESRMFFEITQMLGSDSALLIKRMVQQIVLQSNATWTTVLGLFLFLIGASAGFSQLKLALNQMWSVRPAPEANDLLTFLKNRLVSLLMILVFALFSVFFLFLSSSVTLFGTFLSSYFQISSAFLAIMNGLVFVLVSALLMAILYKYLPDVQLKWAHVLPGAFLSALLFATGKYLIAQYVLRSNIANAYGATASIVVVLVWVYYSSLIVFFGASFVQEYVRHKKYSVSHSKNAVWIRTEVFVDE